MNAVAPADLMVGVNYLMETQSDAQRFPRLWLMSYVGETNDVFRPAGVWNARPAAGTQEIPWRQVLRVRAMTDLPANRRAFDKRFVNKDSRSLPLPVDGWVKVDPTAQAQTSEAGEPLTDNQGLDGCTCGGIGETGSHYVGCAWAASRVAKVPVIPTHAVVDTSDGLAFVKAHDGVLFDLETATAFADKRNAERGDGQPRYQVLALVPPGLLDAAQAVIGRWEHGNLAEAVHSLDIALCGVGPGPENPDDA